MKPLAILLLLTSCAPRFNELYLRSTYANDYTDLKVVQQGGNYTLYRLHFATMRIDTLPLVLTRHEETNPSFWKTGHTLVSGFTLGPEPQTVQIHYYGPADEYQSGSVRVGKQQYTGFVVKRPVKGFFEPVTYVAR
jgi:hypothetical protein